METVGNAQRTRRRLLSWRVLWKVGLLTLAVALGVLAIQSCRHHPMASLDAKDVNRIQVNLPGPSGAAAVFVIDDQATITQIFDAMTPFSRDWFPAKWAKYGSLQVELRSGTVVGIALFEVREEAAAFRIDGVYYRGGSEQRLQEILESEGERRGVKPSP